MKPKGAKTGAKHFSKFFPLPIGLFFGSKAARISGILLLAAAIWATARFAGATHAVTLSMNASNYPSWYLSKVQRIEGGLGHYLIQCDQPCYVISPPVSRFSRVGAADYPYVTLAFDAGSSIRDCRILISSPSEPTKFVARLPLMENDRLLCDLRGREPFTAAVHQIGVSFTGTLLLKQISVSDSLNIFDYGHLFYHQLTSVEPAAPHSINDLYGIYLFGRSHVIVALGFLVLSGLLILAFPRLTSFRPVPIVLACTLAFLYLPWCLYLFDQLKTATGHSSFKYDARDEFASCYGDDFASLSRMLFEKVPPGSGVHFLRQNLDRHLTEANLLEFIYRTRFEPREFGAADFYLAYRWPGVYDSARGLLSDPFTGKTVPAAPVFSGNGSFLLKALR